MNRSTIKRFQSELRQFIESKSSFNVVYSTQSSPISHQTSRLCILDSSFNPPHLGHLSLITKSIDYYHDSPRSTSILLLLSVKNADKLIPKPASFEDRLDMMCLLADHIQNSLNISVSVALTNHAKFVDKSNVVRDWVNEVIGEISKVRFSFLLGFDTLIRVFDPKYYKPFPISDALDGFMKLNDFFCLTRTDDINSNLEDQHRYLQDIAENKTDLPTEWARKIHLIEGEEKSLEISSSTIRKGAALHNEEWKYHVTSTVAAFIERENLY